MLFLGAITSQIFCLIWDTDYVEPFRGRTINKWTNVTDVDSEEVCETRRLCYKKFVIQEVCVYPTLLARCMRLKNLRTLEEC